MEHLSANPSRDAIIKAILDSDPSRDWESARLGNQKTTYFIRNVHLRFESGEGEYFDAVKNFKESWLKFGKLQDPNASSHSFYLFYGATLIKSFVLISVDGGRAWIPMPHPENLAVRQLDYRVALIHDPHGRCDNYMRQFKLTFGNG